MADANLPTEAEKEDQVRFLSNCGNIYQQYLYPKVTWLVTVLNFPFAVTLCTVQIMLMIAFIPLANNFYEVQFEYSGIGIIAAVIYLIAAIITIKTAFNPSFCKIWWSFATQCISFAINVGLIMYALSWPMNFIPWIGRFGECDCFDESGNIINGSNPDYWPCKDSKLNCVEMEYRNSASDWKEKRVWIMIGAAGFQCLWASVHVLMSVCTLIFIGPTMDKKSLARNSGQTKFHRQNAYSEWFPLRFIAVLTGLQLGLGMLSMVLGISSSGTGPGRDLFEFCTIASYVQLSCVIITEPELTYHRLFGIGALHFFTFCSMITCLCALGEPKLYPLAAIEMIISGIIIRESFRPIFKVVNLIPETPD